MLKDSVVPIHPAADDKTDKLPFNSDRFQMLESVLIIIIINICGT